jgi:caffeoyl-CoA O-methyltransferase
MFTLIHPVYEDYAEKHTSPELEILKQLSRETNLKILQPRMLSGHLQGKFLEILSLMLNPTQVLEIGTYTGYSAIAMAQGLKKNGKIHTIEINEELESFVLQHFEEAGLSEKINLYIGNALEIIPQIEQTFDLVFIDADKENYINYFELVFDKVRKGGIIIADNVLWSGKVITDSNANDKDTNGLKAFNEYIMNHSLIENVLLPFRDGLMVIYKK